MKKSVLLLSLIIASAGITEARQPERGYRGFLEWSSSVRSEKFGFPDAQGNLVNERFRFFYTGLTTSHGYQINPKFFIGAGLGMEHCGSHGSDTWVAPVFIQGRADLKFGDFTPFADLRLGANVADGAGIYISPTLGYRFNWGRKMGVNLGAGLSLAGYRIENYEISATESGSYDIQYIGTQHRIRAYFSFRLGIDF